MFSLELTYQKQFDMTYDAQLTRADTLLQPIYIVCIYIYICSCVIKPDFKLSDYPHFGTEYVNWNTLYRFWLYIMYTVQIVSCLTTTFNVQLMNFYASFCT